MDLLQSKLNELNELNIIIEATENINLRTNLILMKNQLTNEITTIKEERKEEMKHNEPEEENKQQKKTKSIKKINQSGKKKRY